MNLVLMVTQELQVAKELQVIKDFQDLRDLRVLLETKEIRVNQERVFPGTKEPQ